MNDNKSKLKGIFIQPEEHKKLRFLAYSNSMSIQDVTGLFIRKGLREAEKKEKYVRDLKLQEDVLALKD